MGSVSLYPNTYLCQDGEYNMTNVLSMFCSANSWKFVMRRDDKMFRASSRKAILIQFNIGISLRGGTHNIPFWLDHSLETIQRKTTSLAKDLFFFKKAY